jgi:hypothetical protein
LTFATPRVLIGLHTADYHKLPSTLVDYLLP